MASRSSYDADRRLAVGRHEDIDGQTLDRAYVVVELVVPVVADLACMLQPVERRLTRQLPARLVQHRGERRIVAQRVVVDQILIAEREAEDALAQQIGHRVRDGVGNAKIAESSGQPIAEPDRSVGRAEQHRTTVRRDRPTVESAHKFAPTGGSEVQLFLATLCRHRGAPPSQTKSLRHNNFAELEPRCSSRVGEFQARPSARNRSLITSMNAWIIGLPRASLPLALIASWGIALVPGLGRVTTIGRRAWITRHGLGRLHLVIASIIRSHVSPDVIGRFWGVRDFDRRRQETGTHI